MRDRKSNVEKKGDGHELAAERAWNGGRVCTHAACPYAVCSSSSAPPRSPFRRKKRFLRSLLDERPSERAVFASGDDARRVLLPQPARRERAQGRGGVRARPLEHRLLVRPGRRPSSPSRTRDAVQDHVLRLCPLRAVRSGLRGGHARASRLGLFALSPASLVLPIRPARKSVFPIQATTSPQIAAAEALAASPTKKRKRARFKMDGAAVSALVRGRRSGR